MIIDLFAGPGGWDEALRTWPDLHAQTLGYEWDRWACATRDAAGHRTIRADVAEVDLAPLLDHDVEGLIGSPPCPTFSGAGAKSGLNELARLIDAAHDHRNLYDVDDQRTSLVLEPLRWARWLRPRWVALEQVPGALPVWHATGHALGRLGYSWWAGVLNAANYGVPQTRKRAILIASLDHQPHRPPPTHEKAPGGLFALPAWVTMAQALGWTGYLDRRQQVAGEPVRMVPTDEPAPTLTGTAGSKSQWLLRSNNTVAGGPLARRPADEPALTVTSRADLWAWERPSTTIDGSFDPETVAAPGWRGPGDGPRQNAPGSVRITLEDALTLQSFDPAYPVQGPKSATFRQIGDAMPPLLARHVLAQATRRTP